MFVMHLNRLPEQVGLQFDHKTDQPCCPLRSLSSRPGDHLIAVCDAVFAVWSRSLPDTACATNRTEVPVDMSSLATDRVVIGADFPHTPYTTIPTWSAEVVGGMVS